MLASKNLNEITFDVLKQGGSTKYHINSRWFQVFKSDRDRRDLVNFFVPFSLLVINFIQLKQIMYCLYVVFHDSLHLYQSHNDLQFIKSAPILNVKEGMLIYNFIDVFKGNLWMCSWSCCCI